MQTYAILKQGLTDVQPLQFIETSIRDGIQEFQKQLQSKDNSEELLTKDETCQFLEIDSSMLWALTNNGKIKKSGIGARRYYKRNELIKCLTLLKK